MAKTFSNETKLEILRRFAGGEKGKDLAKEYGFHPTMISKWRKDTKISSNNQPKKKMTKSKPKPKTDVVKLNENLIFWKGVVYKRVNTDA